MGEQQQKNQYSLVFDEEDKGEASKGLAEGTEAPPATDTDAVATWRRNLETCQALAYAHHFSPKDFLNLIGNVEVNAVSDDGQIIDPKNPTFPFPYDTANPPQTT